jgi:cytochrome P450
VRAGIEEELASLGPDPSPAALAELPYLGAVCDEILRLYPPVPFALRRACEPFTLRGVELEPGDNLAIAMVVLHRNPGVFEQPDAFLPERFLARKYSPFELAPFGGGMRRCIGAAFGAHALRIAIGTVLLHADIELARPLEVSAVTHNITIGPDRRIPLVRQGPGRALR